MPGESVACGQWLERCRLNAGLCCILFVEQLCQNWCWEASSLTTSEKNTYNLIFKLCFSTSHGRKFSLPRPHQVRKREHMRAHLSRPFYVYKSTLHVSSPQLLSLSLPTLLFQETDLSWWPTAGRSQPGLNLITRRRILNTTKGPHWQEHCHKYLHTNSPRPSMSAHEQTSFIVRSCRKTRT